MGLLQIPAHLKGKIPRGVFLNATIKHALILTRQ